MNNLKTTTLATLLLAAAASSLTSQSINYTKTAGNDDAKAEISFVSRLQQGGFSYPSSFNRYYALGNFEATGKVLNQNLDFIDIGARADSYDYMNQVPVERSSVWFYLAGQQLHSTGATNWSTKATVTPAGVSRKVTVGGIITVKVSAGLSVWLKPELDATTGPDKARISAGAEAGVDVSASGKISAGPVASLTVTSNITLVSVAADIVSKATPSVKDAYLRLSGDALRILIKLKLKLVGVINETVTLVDKTVASWSKNLDI